MKIIFLEAVQNFGGSKRSVIEIADQLQKKGHEILIVDFWGANKEFKEKIKNKNLEFEVLESRNEPFVISREDFLIRVLSFLKYIYKRIIYKRKFKKIASLFRPDYVCVNSIKTLDILDKRSKYKIDYYARGWTLGESIAIKILLKKYSPRFIAISEATRHAIFLQNKESLSNIKILKVAIGELPFKKPVSDTNLFFNKDNSIKLLHAGTFVKTKGQHISILVAKSLKNKGVHFKMKIAGLVSVSDDSQKYYESLKKMVFDFGLEDEVEFIVNRHDLSEEMKEMNVFVYPSYTEGLSRVCLEAMSNGKPVIANPVGGITDFVINGHSGYLVEFNDVENYANRILQYYNDYCLYKKHALNAIDIINNGYLVKNLNENLNQIYNKI